MLTRRSNVDPKVLVGDPKVHVGAGQALGKYDYAILPIRGGNMDPSSMPRGPISVYKYRGIYQDSLPITLFKSLCETRILVKRRKR